jgi:hypothetical protein
MISYPPALSQVFIFQGLVCLYDICLSLIRNSRIRLMILLILMNEKNQMQIVQIRHIEFALRP